MRTLLFFLLLCLPLSAKPTLEDLSWITGRWTSQEGLDEEWSTPAQKTMLGHARILGTQPHLEFMLLEELEDGIYLREWFPKLDRKLEFKLAELEGQKARFQRLDKPEESLIYQKLPDGKLSLELVKPKGGFRFVLTQRQ